MALTKGRSKENTHLKMEQFTMVSGLEDSVTATANNSGLMVRVTKVNGFITRRTVEVYSTTSMVTSLTVSGTKIKLMVLGHTST